MSEVVVIGLEMIYIQQQQSDAGWTAMRFNGFGRCMQLRLLSDQTHPFPLKSILKTTSVGDLGQAIDHRHLTQGAIGLRQFRRFEI